jgi:hypothetical protein
MRRPGLRYLAMIVGLVAALATARAGFDEETFAQKSAELRYPRRACA